MVDIEKLIEGAGRMISLQDAELLYQTASEIDAKVIVEIGASQGTSSTVLATVAKEQEGHLYSIECVPKAEWYTNIESRGLTQFATLVEGMSPWLDMSLIPTPIDYLLIDGDHRTRFVMTDYHFWQHYLKATGRIAFHDWTGTYKKEQVQLAVRLILETDPLIEVDRTEGKNRGLIVFNNFERALE